MPRILRIRRGNRTSHPLQASGSQHFHLGDCVGLELQRSWLSVSNTPTPIHRAPRGSLCSLPKTPSCAYTSNKERCRPAAQHHLRVAGVEQDNKSPARAAQGNLESWRGL